ncbi:TetR/AcrR family transcriptional regulator [Lentzea sp. JNUCC 0626]|uniref:TetR/AcrR family transcriptional regulator n=1 Tax=Lentzea sp. JNUCC 0626 TaxID=3367513 RepID=UPI003747A616
MASITRRPSKKAERQAEVEAAVLGATERLLRDGTAFTELGVQRIADAAGIARSTFYLYFRDKTDVMRRITENLGRAAFEAPGTVTADLESITRSQVEIFAFYRERAHLLAAIVEVSGYEPEIRDVWNAAVQRFADNMTRMLEEEQEAGRTSADLVPHTCAEVIVWGGMRAIAHQVATNGLESDLAVARELAANQWYGAFRRP